MFTLIVANFCIGRTYTQLEWMESLIMGETTRALTNNRTLRAISRPTSSDLMTIDFVQLMNLIGIHIGFINLDVTLG